MHSESTCRFWRCGSGHGSDFGPSASRIVGDRSRTKALASLESLLESSWLACEDYFYRPPRNDRERQWLSQNRPEAARHWNLLSGLRPEHLQYVA